MSTFSSDIGPEEEDGAGWGGLVPTAEERRAEKREVQDKNRQGTGQRITYAMLHDDFTAARAIVRQTAPELADWQLRDMRKTSLNDAGTLEEARRRAKHTDPRTTARHYEVRIDAVPGNLPKRNEG